MSDLKRVAASMVFVISIIIIAAAMTGCIASSSHDSNDSGDDSYGESAQTHQYLIIPNASWYSGSPSYTLGGGTAPTATVKEGSQILTAGNSVTWEVNFEAIVEIEAEVSIVVITSDDLDGYFTYPITADDVENGYVDIEMTLEESPPSTAVCNRDYRGNGTCYEQADTGVTSTDFAVANDVGGGMQLTASVEAGLTIADTSDSTGGGTSGDTVCSGWTSFCSCSLRACSDGTNSWYDVGRGVYYCASVTDCSSAAERAVQYCTYGC